LYLQIYISQGNLATQLRSGGIFSNHLITNSPQNVPVYSLKIGEYLEKIWTKVFGLLFWATFIWQKNNNFTIPHYLHAKNPHVCYISQWQLLCSDIKYEHFHACKIFLKALFHTT